MLRLLIVTTNRDALKDLRLSIEKHDEVELFWSGSGKDALRVINDTPPNLVISDEKLEDMSGLELVSKSLAINFTVNFAVISALSSEEFHEKSEGLGVLMQLPPNPGAEHAELLLDQLKQILALSS